MINMGAFRRSSHDHAPCDVPPGTVRHSPFQPDAVILPGAAARSPRPAAGCLRPARASGRERSGVNRPCHSGPGQPLDEGEAVSSSAQTAEFWFDPI